MRTTIARQDPNNVTATATVTRLFVLSVSKLIMIIGTKINALLAKEIIVPVRIVTVETAVVDRRPALLADLIYTKLVLALVLLWTSTMSGAASRA